MRIDLRRVAQGLILFALLITPLLSYGELIALLSDNFLTTELYTPVWIRILKDIVVVSLLAVGLAGAYRRGGIPSLAIPFVLLLIYVVAVSLVAAATDPLLAVSGIRWILPVFAGVAVMPYVDRTLMHRVAQVLGWLLLLHISLQFLQLFFMGRFYGSNIFGLAGRVPGILMNPNSGGFFTILCVFFVHFYRVPRWPPRLVFLLGAVSVFLTQSGTALILFLALTVLTVVGPARAKLLLPVAPAVGLLLFALLPVLTGRGEGVQGSGYGRLEIFLEILGRGELLPIRFGSATNAAVGFGWTVGQGGGIANVAMIADSSYASIVGNLGILGFVAFLLAYVLWLTLVFRTRRTDLYAFTLIFTGYGATLIFFEIYPINLLFAVGLCYSLGELYGPRRRGAPAPLCSDVVPV